MRAALVLLLLALPAVARADPGKVARFRVVDDESGGTIAQASITWIGDAHKTPTRGQVAVFTNIDVAAGTTFLVEAPDYMAMTITSDFSGTIDEIRLRRRWPLEIRLVDLANRPLIHCTIAIPGDDAPHVTDPHGTVQLVIPHGGITFDPSCSHDVNGHAQLAHVAGVSVQTVRLPGNQVYAGKVVDRANHPVAGVVVAATNDQGDDDMPFDTFATTTTDANGNFRFASFRAREVVFVVRGPHHGRPAVVHDPRDPLTIVVDR